MEFVVYILASLIAGVGCGLAGLSLATVMVPMLVVLCPSFAGETGAYAATAIALAADAPAAAVSAFTYFRHGHIDLRRGGIMMGCMIPACIAGSIVAFYVGNVVLGAFTLFLTFCIGIRFLVKPDTTREDTVAQGAPLDVRGVAVSIFFGLTIGFGTGFVGSGGGMMMLVVFTAFLGMGLRDSVGTSTFIMTFTAGIAAVSHVLIEPSIVLERWPVLLTCTIVSFVAARGSALFANCVAPRTVGLVTGAVLTVLGAILIVLHYWDVISTWPLVPDVLVCAVRYASYIVPVAGTLILMHLFLHVPRELFRKMLHGAAFTSAPVVMFLAGRWEIAVLTLLLVGAFIWPLLAVLESQEWFADLFVQRRTHEVRRSLLLLFWGNALVVGLCWGLFGHRDYAVASILMWGLGDAAAALIGIKFGKHKTGLPLADPNKTWEGSGAMAAAAFAVGTVTLTLLGMPLPAALVHAAAGSVAGAYVELITHKGYDTITVPAAIAAVLLILG